jgi:hypothetical protein
MNESKKTEANPNGWPLFVSTTGEPVLLALLSGHSDSVGTEPKPLHPRFHRLAVTKGVVPAQMVGSLQQEETQSPTIERQAMLIKVIADMVADATANPTKTDELFTNDGRPDARQMSIRLGFPVKAEERDAAWEVYSGEKD